MFMDLLFEAALKFDTPESAQDSFGQVTSLVKAEGLT